MNKKGFTLTELLVVISIIALISSISLITLNSTRAKARDGNRMNDIGTLYKAIEIHIANYGVPPAIPDDYDDLAVGSGINKLTGYLASGAMPHDPDSSRFYFYCRNGNRYLTGTLLEQEKTTQGDIDGAISVLNPLSSNCVTSNDKSVQILVCDDDTGGGIIILGLGSLTGGPAVCLGKL